MADGFLTDTQKAVLADEYDGSDSARRAQKSRIRSRARQSIADLITVAQSDAVDNEDIFDPNDLARLIDSLMTPDGGLTPRWNYSGTSQEHREEYLYQYALHGRLDHALDGYGDFLHRDVPPGETVSFLPESDD
jgi:hypothetical protein